MGMIRSMITVVGADEDTAARSESGKPTPLPTLPGGVSSGSCCGTIPPASTETPTATTKPITTLKPTAPPEEVYDPELDYEAGCCG